MTTRERSLLVILLIALIGTAVAIGIDVYLERLAALDADFIALQKRALRDVQAAQGSRRAAKGDWSRLKEKFFTPGTLSDPLEFASLVQETLKSSGLAVSESRIMENSASSQWLQYRTEGSIDSWFRFLTLIRNKDVRSLFRTISIVKKEGPSYAIAFEVGHAVQP